MFYLIAHRGNIKGPVPEKENSPDYIQAALDKGYDAEIDLWYVDGKFLLGHDEPTYEVDESFLLKSGLWIHCKDARTLSKMMFSMSSCNCFFHNTDDVVLTSKGFLWTFPGKPLYSNSICVLPEWKVSTNMLAACGICSDFVENWR